MKKQLTCILLLAMAGKLFAAAEAEQIGIKNNTGYIIRAVRTVGGKQMRHDINPNDSWVIPEAKSDIKALHFTVPDSYYPAYLYQVENLRTTQGSVLVTFETSIAGFYTTVSSSEQSQFKDITKTSQAATALENDLLKKLDAFDTGKDIRSLIQQGYSLEDIARHYPYLFFGFQTAPKGLQENAITSAVNNMKGRLGFDNLSLPLQQTINQAEFYLKEGGENQKQILIALGKQFNNALLEGTSSNISNDTQKKYGDIYQTVLVKSLLLYYYDIAHKLGHTFDQGTFVVYDPSGRIWKFFNSLVNRYTRDASHFNALAKGSPALGTAKPWLAQYGKNHFGFDIAIPEEGKATLLFNKINEDGSSFYLKPEDHGTNSWTDLIAHGAGFVMSQARKIAPDIAGNDDADEFSKERIPQDLLKNYLALLQQAQQKGLNSNTASTLAEQAKAEGIQGMLRGENALLQYVPDQAKSFFADLKEKEQVHNPHFTYLNKRFGREVILTPAEFAQ